MTLRDRLQRRVIPRAIVWLSTVRAPRRLAARVQRALGRRGRVELFVAFDDPYSAVALIELDERLRGRPVTLDVRPVVERGIPGDPAAQAKRAYAVVDAKRLAARSGRRLAIGEPIDPEAVAPLARRAAAIADPAERLAFSVVAMRRLWFDGGMPEAGGAAGRTSERAFRRRRLYDVPVAVVGGQWFFAHERLAQIEHRLDELGWVA